VKFATSSFRTQDLKHAFARMRAVNAHIATDALTGEPPKPAKTASSQPSLIVGSGIGGLESIACHPTPLSFARTMSAPALPSMLGGALWLAIDARHPGGGQKSGAYS